MAEATESVKIPRHVLEIYREWAQRSGRSVQGIIALVLGEAVGHYLEGKSSGIKELSEDLKHISGGKKK